MRSLFLLAVGLLSFTLFASVGKPRFSMAVPVWPEGRENETNTFFNFRADFHAEKDDHPVLRITASTYYRVYVNGAFVGHGPVRATHGFFRIDEWPLDAVVRAGVNAIAVEVRHYGCVTVDIAGEQTGFLACEVMAGSRTLCATGRDFTWSETRREQNTSIITPQRAPVEYYRLDPGFDDWRTAPGWKGREPARRPEAEWLTRLSPYPEFKTVRPKDFFSTSFRYDDRSPRNSTRLNRRYSWDGHDELSRISDPRVRPLGGTSCPVSLTKGFLADFGRIDSGFIGFTVECDGPTTVYAVFDEMAVDGIPNPWVRWAKDTMAVWELSAAGRYVCEMFEPTGVRYLHVFARKGAARVSDVYLREFKNHLVYAAEFSCSDERLNRVFAAARETCAQCTMDATLDNPIRERNSGPCDSFFTLGGYGLLSGDFSLERLFFENYMLPKDYPGIVHPMIPAFYPCSQFSAYVGHITTYVPWFFIELERYTDETGDTSVRDAMRDRLLEIAAFYRGFCNSDGLIEDIKWWTFVGWDMSSTFTKGVHYPLNMLWAEGLDVLSRLYGRPELSAEAARIRAKVLEQSWNGEWYRDHALRDAHGNLVVQSEISELCQYYALRFGVADPSKDVEFWEKTIRTLGRSGPGYGKAIGRMYPANYFQGIMIRHWLLAENGRDREAVKELGYLTDMSDAAGTLWEGYPDMSSEIVPFPQDNCLCQGFTSYAANLLFRSALGLRKLDRRNRRVLVSAPENGLDHCRGTIPTAEGPFVYGWRREGDRIVEDVRLPPGWSRD